jgi:hypothetical protein
MGLLQEMQTPEEMRQCAEKMIAILWNGIKPEPE